MNESSQHVFNWINTDEELAVAFQGLWYESGEDAEKFHANACSLLRIVAAQHPLAARTLAACDLAAVTIRFVERWQEEQD